MTEEEICQEQIEHWFSGKVFYNVCGKRADFKITTLDELMYRCQKHKNYLCMDLAKLGYKYEVEVIQSKKGKE